MSYNPKTERLVVSRDLMKEDSEVFEHGYLGTLRKLSGFHRSRDLHVSTLTQSHVGRILNNYPNDDPYELFVEALGELQLDPLKYGHIEAPKVYKDKRRLYGRGLIRYFVVCPMDRTGTRRVRNDTQKILGHFGINGSIYKELRPHVTLTFVDEDKRYANYLAEKAEESMGEMEPISLSFPVVDYRVISKSS